MDDIKDGDLTPPEAEISSKNKSNIKDLQIFFTL